MRCSTNLDLAPGRGTASGKTTRHSGMAFLAKLAFTGVALTYSYVALGAEPSTTDVKALEQRAIALADDFVKTLYSKDAERALTYLNEDTAISVDPTGPSQKGPGALARIVKMSKTGSPIKVTLERSYALGGPQQIMVIQRRNDASSLGGKSFSGNNGAIYLIDPKTWKIKYFSDVAIEPPPANMPPPPPGFLEDKK